jgi:hypothetical protein
LATDAARRPGHQHRAIAGLEPVVFQSHHRQHRGETRGSNGHGLAGGDAGGQRRQPLAFDPRLLGVAAPPRLADAPAGENHLVAGLVGRVVRFLDRAGQVDARNMGKLADQPATGRYAQPVLVVQG